MSKLIIPPGKGTGCLIRASKIGTLCPLASEHIEVIPQQEWAELIGESDLRPFAGPVNDQGRVGSCATESTGKSEEIAETMEGRIPTRLNPWFLYHHSSHGVDRGSAIDENLALARDIGIAPLDIWPREKGWQAKPSDEAYQAALLHRIGEFFDIGSVEEIGSALLRGFAVVFGWQGHSVIFTSLKNINEGEYLNSWAVSWGDFGYGRLPLTSVNFAYGAFAVRVSARNS